MTPFERAISFILRPDIEGKSSKDPNDPGNWTGGKVNVGTLNGTMYGISAAAYPLLDIQALTREQCIAIYKADYWDKCKCGQLPSPLALMVMDIAVNQGVSTAGYLLQEALSVKQDGIIGTVTVSHALKANIKDTLTMLMAARCVRYSIAKNVGRYGKGWFRRAAACLITAMEPL